MRLNPSSLSYHHPCLDLYKGADKNPVLQGAPIKIAWLHDLNL
jgi:hypothetical protein